MIEFKANNMKIVDIDTLETITEYDLNNVVIEAEVETCSLSKERPSFTTETTFDVSTEDYSRLLDYAYTTDFNNSPFYITYDIPIMIQARWHKKPRINKKWLKRYGMKEDNILVKCDVDSISPDNSYDPYNLIESKGYNFELSNMQYKFRPDQLRKNLKIEMRYE